MRSVFSFASACLTAAVLVRLVGTVVIPVSEPVHRVPVRRVPRRSLRRR